jgi:hypothetical protein
MPDAEWWDQPDPDDVPATLPAAQAEVRRLRAELLRCQDLAEQARSWTACRTACEQIAGLARRALAWRRAP